LLAAELAEEIIQMKKVAAAEALEELFILLARS
jgi:hypothetical protein